MEKAWSLALWCVLVCYNTGYRVGKLPGLPSRQKGIMSMARYHYTRENENGVVLYLESEPAEDAMDEFDDEIAVGFSGNGGQTCRGFQHSDRLRVSLGTLRPSEC